MSKSRGLDQMQHFYLNKFVDFKTNKIGLILSFKHIEELHEALESLCQLEEALAKQILPLVYV